MNRSGACCRLQYLIPEQCPCQPQFSSADFGPKREDISAELRARLKEAFDILDRDCDTLIDGMQMETVMRMAGMNPLYGLTGKDVVISHTAITIEDTESYDSAKQGESAGKISFEDVVIAATDIWNDKETFKQAKSAFSHYGMDKLTSKEELRTILTNYGVANIDEKTLGLMEAEARGLYDGDELASKFVRGSPPRAQIQQKSTQSLRID